MGTSRPLRPLLHCQFQVDRLPTSIVQPTPARSSLRQTSCRAYRPAIGGKPVEECLPRTLSTTPSQTRSLRAHCRTHPREGDWPPAGLSQPPLSDTLVVHPTPGLLLGGFHTLTPGSPGAVARSVFPRSPRSSWRRTQRVTCEAHHPSMMGGIPATARLPHATRGHPQARPRTMSLGSLARLNRHRTASNQ